MDTPLYDLPFSADPTTFKGSAPAADEIVASLLVEFSEIANNLRCHQKDIVLARARMWRTRRTALFNAEMKAST
jgi:hypothetical protein